jgi:hypothetical protein
MYRNVLHTKPAEESTYVSLGDYMADRAPACRPAGAAPWAPVASVASIDALNTSAMADFYEYVRSTSRMHGYMTHSDFAAFLTAVAAAVTATGEGGSEESDAADPA